MACQAVLDGITCQATAQLVSKSVSHSMMEQQSFAAPFKSQRRPSGSRAVALLTLKQDWRELGLRWASHGSAK